MAVAAASHGNRRAAKARNRVGLARSISVMGILLMVEVATGNRHEWLQGELMGINPVRAGGLRRRHTVQRPGQTETARTGSKTEPRTTAAQRWLLPTPQHQRSAPESTAAIPIRQAAARPDAASRRAQHRSCR